MDRARITLLCLPALALAGCREELPRARALSTENTVQTGASASFGANPRSGKLGVIPGSGTRENQGLALDWDAKLKEIYSKPGSEAVDCFYEVTNNTDQKATITLIEPSCGCSIVDSPPLPWTLEPGERDKIEVGIDLKGKWGILTKSIRIESTFGLQNLVFKVHIPEVSQASRSIRTMKERLANIKVAAADRQAVFKNDCRKCHYDTALGKEGEELFQAACGICHDTPHRATMVPDLAAFGTRDASYWRFWMTTGKSDSLMPAFGEKDGGPLTDEQIGHLAGYLTTRFEATGFKQTEIGAGQ